MTTRSYARADVYSGLWRKLQVFSIKRLSDVGRVETLRAGEADVPQVAVLDLETTACPPATALNLGGLAFVSDYIVS